MKMLPESNVIDKIYEAAILPELWEAAIEAVAGQTRCYGGSLFTLGSRGTIVSASRNCADHLRALMEDGWAERNIRAQRVVSAARIGFITDHDICTDEEIANHPIYSEFLRPRGLGWSAATMIAGANEDIALFCIDQSYAEGPISQEVRSYLDGLRPHVARAAMLAAQFQMERVRASVNSLEIVGIPAAAIDRSGRVRVANQRFQAVEQHARIAAFDQLEIRDEQARALFREAVAHLDADRVPRSIPAFGEGEAPPCILHIVPVKRQARDIFSQVDAIVALVPLNSPGLPFRDVLRKLYDLTQAEARVAEALVSGESVQRFAETQGVGIETVRTHMKRVLAKTGVKRQADFIVRFSTFKSLEKAGGQ